MKFRKEIYLLAVSAVIISLSACQKPGGNSPGSEYMPDMAHSTAYEANTYTYYYNNTWGGEDEYYKYAQPRLPQAGTISRKVGNAATEDNSLHYPYGNTEEERTRATNELVENPYPITDAGLKAAKEHYNVYCGICHGEKGDGAGYIVRDDGGKYPAQPANFLLDEFVSASNGRYYHAIMHGKNVMGAYNDKLNYEERWQVIHYIRALQAKDKKLAYNQYENTLNAIDRPAGDIVMVETTKEEVHEDHSHGVDHGHHEHDESHDHNHDHSEPHGDEHHEGDHH